jgi:hypothetical protein
VVPRGRRRRRGSAGQTSAWFPGRDVGVVRWAKRRCGFRGLRCVSVLVGAVGVKGAFGVRCADRTSSTLDTHHTDQGRTQLRGSRAGVWPGMGWIAPAEVVPGRIVDSPGPRGQSGPGWRDCLCVKVVRLGLTGRGGGDLGRVVPPNRCKILPRSPCPPPIGPDIPGCGRNRPHPGQPSDRRHRRRVFHSWSGKTLRQAQENPPLIEQAAPSSPEGVRGPPDPPKSTPDPRSAPRSTANTGDHSGEQLRDSCVLPWSGWWVSRVELVRSAQRTPKAPLTHATPTSTLTQPGAATPH